jgi:inner membrane protein
MNIIDTIMGLDAQWHWFALAAVLAIMEIAIAPGIFLIFIAIAAALTGFATMFIDISLPAQLIFFAISSLIAVYAGRQWYLTRGHESADPLLNDRAARMVGQTVTVLEAISANGGRVRVGDSEWPAFGVPLKAGAKGKIIAVVNGKIEVEAAD